MLLEKLSNARGVSGDEAAVRAIITAHLQKHVDEYRVDAMGNVLAMKRGTARGTAHRVLVAAHMDEVGFLITHIDSDGYLQFEKIGGIDDRILPSKAVRIGVNGIPAMIIEHTLPELEREANHILQQLTGGRMHVRFETHRDGLIEQRGEGLRGALRIDFLG